jgi:nucleoside-diphosphate-sugar epimerase
VSSGCAPISAIARPMPTAIAITGGTGALGRYTLRHLLACTTLPIRVLVHRSPLAAEVQDPRITTVRGSLLDAPSLEAWLTPGASVIHLAWSSSFTLDQHLAAVTHLIDAAAAVGVRRFVHCSTAMVAGRAAARVIDEGTPCEPANDYERHKYEVELRLERAASGRVPVVIVRPTAIIGPGLQNLESLVTSLRGRRLTNYARTSLFGRREMHLVPAGTVAAALGFVALGADGRGDAPTMTRYIVSADGEPGGDFQSVEKHLRRGLGLGRSAPALPLPAWCLRLVLAVAGRSDTDPRRRYDGSLLRSRGFVPPVTLLQALDHYAAWHRTGCREQGTA